MSRPAFSALWNIDLAFADVVASSSDPRLGVIRMAWWRERLDDLDESAAAPPEPRLRAAQADLLPRGISGHELSKLEDAWLPLLEPFPWREDVAAGLEHRGRILFGIGARLLDGEPDDAEAAGALWSLVDGARHCSDIQSRMFLLEQARTAIRNLPTPRPPRFLRRLTSLGAMAAHDVMRNRPLDLPYFDAGRGMAAILHMARGTLPRR
jgi:phytoene synthase